MAIEPVHGGHTGVADHNRRHEALCQLCAPFAADRARAHRVVSRKNKTVQISVLGVARILRGWDPEQVLAAEFGPATLAAVRGFRAGEKRG
jgi:hypothetical protein